MIWKPWIIKARNSIANIIMECDSMAAINESKLTSSERIYLQKKLGEIKDWIDNRLIKK